MNSPPKKESFFLNKFIQTLNSEMIPLEVIDTNGNAYATDMPDIRHKIVIRDNKFFKALLSPNALSLGEAYVKGYFDISGSIRQLYEMCSSRLLQTEQKISFVKLCSNFFSKPKLKEKENIEYHYDVPSDFYRLFLGRTMGYTCGYYASDTTTMDDAQNEKMDIICRKLRLEKGETLLDIGCGWGNFAVYAAKNYGVNVIGITLSREQQQYAEKWIEREDLKGLVDIRILNYRDLDPERDGIGPFDKIACIGMSEHVGKKNMPLFFNTVSNCLKKGGLFMQHTITTYTDRKKGYENTFLDKYMFPGGELMFEYDLIKTASRSGLELLNAENFRTHYIKTLNDWIVRMEKHKRQLLKVVSDSVYRIYHVFFIGSLISFKFQEIALFQNLFQKPIKNQIDTDLFLSLYARNESRIT